jgi:hypothetical protein
MDESNDSSDAVRLSIFIQGITKSFEVLELASLKFSWQNMGRFVSECVRNQEGTSAALDKTNRAIYNAVFVLVTVQTSYHFITLNMTRLPKWLIAPLLDHNKI